MSCCFWLYFFAINTIIGIALFEWAWATSKKLRNLDQSVESKFPAFRRTDKKWEKLHYYIFTPFTLIRAFIAVGSIVFVSTAYR